MQVLCKFKSRKTGEIKEMWLTKNQYENLSFEFEEEFKQIG